MPFKLSLEGCSRVDAVITITAGEPLCVEGTEMRLDGHLS